jgi:hypothetical protein
MSRRSKRSFTLLTLAAAAAFSAAAGATTTAPAAAPSARPAALPPQARALFQRLQRQSPVEEPPGRAGPEPEPPTQPSLVWVLPEQAQALAERLPRIPEALQPAVRRAAQQLLQARWQLQQGGRGGDPLAAAVRTAALAQHELALAMQQSPDAAPLLLPAVQMVREAAMRHGGRMVELARRSGAGATQLAAAETALARADALHAAGQFGPGLGQVAEGLQLASGGLVFDLDRFEQILRTYLDPQTLGMAYAIAAGGQLARHGSSGHARTSANAPATLQSSNRPMHVASVSKMLTAVVVLGQLHGLGKTPDEPIGPWLPSDWVRGAGIDGIDGLSFAEVLGHQSGFEQNEVAGSSYEKLRDVVAKPVQSTSYAYNNANFGLMRVLSARLAGFDPALFGNAAAPASASLFQLMAELRYAPIGMPFGCEPAASKPTVIYRFPDAGAAGYVHQSKTLSCGGFGVFASAQDLVRVAAHLRHGQQLVPAPVWRWMSERYLGLLPPNRFGWGEGVFGEYFNHGGDWRKASQGGSGRLGTCVMAFPIGIEVALVINSGPGSGGYLGGLHQCSVLKWVYEQSWVAS